MKIIISLISFPIEVNATIYSFIARFDNEREIHAELKEITENDQINNIFTIHLGMSVNLFLNYLI